MKRRKIAAVAVAVVLAATGCAGQGNAKKASGPSKIDNDGVVTIANGGPTFPKNFNVYGASSNGTAPGLRYVYETPFLVSKTNPGDLVPRLAESYELFDGGRTLRFNVRKGVKWSDGKELTAKDFAYTYGFVIGDACPDPDKCWAKKPPEVVDKYTVDLFFNDPQKWQVYNFSLWYPIYPAHIWEDRDRETAINKNPVGTGPMTLDSFSPQQVVYKMRDDYWGGKGNGVEKVKIVPMGPIGGVQAQLDRGELDFAEGMAPGVKADFVSMNPELNHYDFYPSGGSQGVSFNVDLKPFTEVAVRRALRAAVDAQAAAELSEIGYTVPSVVGVDPVVYKDTLKPEYGKAMQQDVAAAKQELADAGWTIKNGHLTKAGKSYPLELAVDNGNQVWMQASQVYIDSWEKGLGLKVKWRPMPSQVFNDRMKLGKLPMFTSSTVGSGNWYMGFQGYSFSNYRENGDKDACCNFGRWHNAHASHGVSTMSDTSPRDEQKLQQLYNEIQDAVAKDAPYIPTATVGTGIMWSSRKWAGFPEPATTDWIPSTVEYNDSIETILALKPA